MLRIKQADPLIWLHADDAQARGIGDGDETVVKSPEGSITVQAKISSEVQPGVVVIDFGWGSPWDRGANVNILTTDNARDPVCAATPNRRFPCEVERA